MVGQVGVYCLDPDGNGVLVVRVGGTDTGVVGMKKSVDVAYLNAVDGGSGLTRMDLDQVPVWLAKHPGYLIRELVVVDNLADAREHAAARNAGLHNLANRLIQQAR